MAWAKGFNFRNYTGLAGDEGTDNQVVYTSDIYPVTRNGVTFGWLTAPACAGDAPDVYDKRIAGYQGAYADGGSGSSKKFYVDLPGSATYTADLNVANFDARGYSATSYYFLNDGAAGRATGYFYNDVTPYVYDVTGWNWTPDTWADSHQTADYSFTSGQARIQVNASTTNAVLGFCHFKLSTTATFPTFKAAWAAQSNQLIGGLN